MTTLAQVQPAARVMATSHLLTATPLTTRATLASALLTTLVHIQEALTTDPELLEGQALAISPALVVTTLAILAILVSDPRVILAHIRAPTSMVAVLLVVQDMAINHPTTPPVITRTLASKAV